MATTITDLGSAVAPLAINNDGQIVGGQHTAGGDYAFLYTPTAPGGISGVTVDFAPGGTATAINNSGEIAVVSDFGNAFIPNHVLAGIFPDFADLGQGGAQGINDAGQIAGYVDNSAAIHTIYGQTLLGAGPGSVAWDINNYGQVTGEALFGGTADHAFIYSNGALTDLGTLLSSNLGCGSQGQAINDSGQVAGYSCAPGGEHAFLYTDGHMVDLGVLGNGISSAAYGINDAGDVVGYSAEWGGANQRAFVYSNGVLIDLNSLLASDSGWVLQNATGINDRGQIIGTGLFNGQNSGFLLDTDFSTGAVATPEPASWILLAFGIAVFWFHREAAINKLLSRSERRLMKFAQTLHVAGNPAPTLAAAIRRRSGKLPARCISADLPVQRRDYQMSTAPQRLPNPRDIRGAILRLRQEMKHRPVVPNVVRSSGKRRLRNIGSNPFHARCLRPKPGFRRINRRLRNIQNCQLTVSTSGQIVNERRLPTPHIDHPRLAIPRIPFDERNRRFQMRTKPAHLIGGLRPIHVFPMLFPIDHSDLRWV